ncbi:MAG: hypothetical protein GY835_07150 [bacterium]|nr:hypothetical protein [bacterium]
MEIDKVTIEWPGKLIELAGEIRKLDLTDGTEIIRLGSSLELLFSDIPGPLASTEFFGNRCLFALQKIYSKTVADPESVKETLCQVLENINAVGEGDSDGMGLLSDAVDHLEVLLTQEMGAVAADDSNSSAATEAAAESSPEPDLPTVEAGEPPVADDTPAEAVPEQEAKTYNLNEIASMLVTIEIDDLQGLDAIRQAMLRFTSDASESIVKNVANAAESLGKFIDEEQEESLLYEVSGSIEAAMKLMEDQDNAAPEDAAESPAASVAETEPEVAPVADEEVRVEPVSAEETVEHVLEKPEPEVEAVEPIQDAPEAPSAEDDVTGDDPAEISPSAETEEITDDEIVSSTESVLPLDEEGAEREPDILFDDEESDKEPESPVQGEISATAEVHDETGESVVPDSLDVDMAGEYVTECREFLEDSEGALLDLEQNPKNVEAVNRVFRAFHTIKGTSSFLQLAAIAELAHKAETILSMVRDRELVFNAKCANLSLRSVDMLKVLLQVVQDYLDGGSRSKPAGYDALLTALKDIDALSSEDIPAGSVEDIPSGNGDEVTEFEQVGEKPAHHTSSFETSVRIRTDRLDRLIDTVGELVIAQSMLAQDELVANQTGADLGKKVGHAGKIVRELQDLSMAMRMVPFKGTFQKMARLVRDLAQKNGKKVEFLRDGEETEIDRNMVDLISDPLVHMIRNAVDHGIEAPEDRIAAGKDPRGCVKLAAYHAGGNVIVQLLDDGHGLDPKKIFQKAVEKGVIPADTSLTEAEIFNLIFAAGFSTADQVSDVSGRGVGMDVVKRNIEALNGRVDISSTLGQGTQFTIKLPLTMAITDGMLISVGEQRFIIPTLNIEVSMRPEAKDISSVASRGKMISLRGQQLPLYTLYEIFDIEGAVTDPTEGLVMVMDTGDRRYAILVDELLGKLQVVAKSLSDSIGKLEGISGGAILGDGHVGLILDPTGLMLLALTKTDGKEILCAGNG